MLSGRMSCGVVSLSCCGVLSVIVSPTVSGGVAVVNSGNADDQNNGGYLRGNVKRRVKTIWINTLFRSMLPLFAFANNAPLLFRGVILLSVYFLAFAMCLQLCVYEFGAFCLFILLHFILISVHLHT